MKKALFLSLLIILTGCNSNPASDYIPYQDIPQDYSPENAKDDNLVVHENVNITSGQAVWDAFVESTEKGEPCTVRLAFYYTLDNQNISPEYYEEIKDDYPAMYIQDLSYDGNTYTLFYIEDGSEYTFQYKFLKQMTEVTPPLTAIYTKRDMYVLVNDEDVTWEELWNGILLRFGDYIDHKTVYSKYTYKE